MSIRVASLGLVLLSVVFSASGAFAGLLPTKASALVTALSSPTGCPISGGPVLDVRVNADATTSAFTIPAGQVFVITGFGWKVTALTPNIVTVTTLVLVNGASFVPVLSSSAVADGAGAAAAQVTIPNGVAVKSGTSVCVAASGTFVEMDVHGYFAKDK